MKKSIFFILLTIAFFSVVALASFEYSKIDPRTSQLSQGRKYVPPDVQRFGFTHNWVRR